MKRLILILALCLILPAALNAKREEPLLRAGIISDIHITAKTSPMDSVFRKSLEYFKGKGVDAVVIAGDFLTNGTEDEMAKVAKIWFSVFPDDKGLKGRHVERIFIYGHQEIEGHAEKAALKRYSPEYLAAFNIADRRAELWEKYFHEPFKPFYRKEVNGYTFLAAHYAGADVTPGMAEFFAAQQTSLPPIDKPIFYIQHKHPGKTVPWDTDNGKSTAILRNYPNLICFSGHSHMSLTDEKSIWQNHFTSVNTASLKQLKCREGRENSATEKGYVSQMPAHKLWHSHQGMLMSVYADRVELDRYDFHDGESLGVWSIPTDVSQRPYNWGVRRLKGLEFPPAFQGNMPVETVKKKGKNRNGAKIAQIHVNFPVAVSHKGRQRALDYRVSVELMSSETVMSKRVYSTLFYLSEGRDREKGGTCCFSEAELPKGAPFRFAVRPVDSFDNEGEAIYSEYLVLYEND